MQFRNIYKGGTTKRHFCRLILALCFAPGLVFVLSPAALAIKAGGIISGSTSWKGDVLVTSGVLVEKGAALTIAPGTTVRVKTAVTSKTDPEFLSPFTEITVRGRLNAEGTPKNPISFISADGGKWAGIQVDGGTARIGNAKVENAETGLYCIRCKAKVQKSAFSSDDYGVVLYGTKPAVSLDDVRIEGGREGLLLLGNPLLKKKNVVLKSNEEEESAWAKISSPFRLGKKPSVPQSGVKKAKNVPVTIYDREATLQDDTIWSGNIIIEKGLKVAPGVKLLILPGTVVRFGFLDTNGDGIGESGITSQGTIWAMGSRLAPITFTSERVKRMGAWDSVSLMASDAAQSIFEHCIVRYAYRGIHSHFSSLKIEHGVFEDDMRGIQFQNSQAVINKNLVVHDLTGVQFRNASVRMEGNTIADNYIGINFLMAKTVFDGNTVEGNIICGLRARQSKFAAKDNCFTANRSGISLEDSQATLLANRMTGNWESGLYLKDSQVLASANTIGGNGESGLYVMGSTGALTGNGIMDNRENGISFDGFEGRVSGNVIDGNGKNGVSVKKLGAALADNSIYKNRKYNLGLKTAAGVEAAGNWWGTDDESMIRKTIFDRKNDPRLGRARIMPFLHTPPASEKKKRRPAQEVKG